MNTMNAKVDNVLPKVLPDCVKLLIIECHSLGDSFMRNTMSRYGSQDSKGNMLITIEDIIKSLNILGYKCRFADTHDLTWWIFNSNLIVRKVPQSLRQDVIFVKVDKLIDALQEEYIAMGLK